MISFWRIFLCRIKLLVLQREFLLFSVILFVVSIFFGNGSIGSLKGSAANIPVAVIDQDQTEISREVIMNVQKNPSIHLSELPREEAMRRLQTSTVDAVCIIREDFSDNLYADQLKELIEIYTIPAPVTSGIVAEAFSGETMKAWIGIKSISGILEEYGMTMDEAQESFLDEIQDFQKNAIQEHPLLIIEYHEQRGDGADNFKMDDKDNLKRLIRYWNVVSAFLAFLGSLWLLKEKENGFLRRISTTTGGLLYYLSSSALTVSFFIWCLSVFSILVCGEATGKLLAACLLLMFFYICISVSLGFVMAALCGSIWRMMVVIPAATFVMALFGGSIINLSEVLTHWKMIAQWTPSYWLNEGFSSILAGEPLGYIVILVMAAVAAAVLSLVPYLLSHHVRR